MFLFENQTLQWKGYFRFQFKDPEFNVRENTKFLKSINVKKVDKRKIGVRWSFAVYLDDIKNQLPYLAAHYSRYLL
ncbi:hypothetical protein D3C72_2269750 [compost metagenome]